MFDSLAPGTYVVSHERGWASRRISFGQETIDIVQELDFDDPEAWAMKFFTSASLLTSLGGVEKRDAVVTVSVAYIADHEPVFRPLAVAMESSALKTTPADQRVARRRSPKRRSHA